MRGRHRRAADRVVAAGSGRHRTNAAGDAFARPCAGAIARSGLSLDRLRALRNCRVGRIETDSARGVTLAELLFDRVLERGETHLAEYSLEHGAPPAEPPNTHFREFDRPVREYLLEVRFGAGSRPRRSWQYARAGAEGPPEHRELRFDESSGVHAVALDLGPGLFGLGWS
ncbi:hypothetical protein B0I33_106227 [Prauserella shujinwangii]|uniref:Uncharacterized protein n=1 Tax=Prauserella shujinwangii TaxID=1453103 RepID=A0A2T0LTQ9_9PSEU|nr:hypothetical protein [Prauserella shujinwangii]PRX47128.1 hypothetical protein B0I33_106227 [Prauserella shujinwangii]